MPIEHVRSGNAVEVRITGLLHKRELDDVQAAAARAIEADGAGLRMLFVLEPGFEGWARGSDWNDMAFYSRYGRDIERIAVVGDARWRDEALMFAGAGVRKTPVVFFTPGDVAQARAWLAE